MKKLLLMTACSLILFTGCFEKNKKKESNSDVKVAINQIEGINVTTYNGKNNNMVFVVKNNGKDTADYINIDIAFYDANGKLTKTDKQYARNLLAGSEAMVRVDLTEYSNDGKTKLPNKIEVAVNKTDYGTTFEEVYTSKVSGKVEKSETEGQLTLTLTNQSGKTLDEVSPAVVFYKDSKPVDVVIDYLYNVGETSTSTIYIPTYIDKEETKYLDYDDVKVVINSAFSYIQNTNEPQVTE